MGRSSREMAEAANKRRQALGLHVQGASYQQIAERLGYATRGSAHAAVKAALAERSPSSPDVGESYRVEAARLDVVIAALSPRVKAGDVQAVDRYLRAIERRTVVAGLLEGAEAGTAEVAKEAATPLDELRSRRAARAARGTVSARPGVS